MKFSTLVLCGVCLILSATHLSAQFRGTCGVTDPTELLERVDANKAALAAAPIQMRSAIVKYVPVTVHLIADDNGNGRAREEQALDQMDKLNFYYADQDMYFYLHQIKYKDNTLIYDTPSSGGAIFQMKLIRDNSALNIYVCNTAENGSGNPGVTLGYYSPQNDWIVMRKSEFNGLNNTLAHEIGHFFSLPHPHSGWECEPYDEEMHGNPVSSIWSPCNGSLQVEFENGSNCNISGDRICDTSPDYNFGFGWNVGGDQCAEFTPQIMDPNGDVVTVTENNHMAYFINCDDYMFTPNQKSLMQTDFFSSARSYLRTGYVPTQDDVNNTLVYNYPINGEEVGTTDIVDLDWEDQPGATDYLVIIDRSSTFGLIPRRFLVTESFLTVDGLSPNLTYYWRVWPFNESETGAKWATTQNFRTSEPSAVETISSVESLEVYPNPAGSTDQITVLMESNEALDCQVGLYNLIGDQVWSTESWQITAGSLAVLSIDVKKALPAGMYLLKIASSEGGIVTRKISVL